MQGDRVRTPDGFGTITGEYNRDPRRVGHFLVELENGTEGAYHRYTLQPERFIDFLRRPGHIGKWTHKEFGIVMVFVLGLVVAGILTWSDKGWWGVVAAVVILGWILFGMWGNWSRRML